NPSAPPPSFSPPADIPDGPWARAGVSCLHAMSGRGKKSGKGAEDLGRALIRQQNRAAAAAKERGEALASSSRRRAPPLESVIDVSEIDAVLQRAAEEDRLHSALAAAASASSSDLVIDLDATGETAEERRRLRKEQEALYANSLGVPRRPPWTNRMTAEELDTSERQAFLEWRRNLARLEENDKLVLTPFEKNIDIWRQLWRVIERSDLLVMVVDARDPLFYRCPDLEVVYAKELDEHKRTMLLVNKADLLPLNIRKIWADYFKEHDILHVFWSAKAATATLEGKMSSGEEDSASPDMDTKIYGREELLMRLQAEAKSIAAQRRTSASKGEQEASSTDSVSSVAKHVVAGFVGYPNVGKSSTINALVGEKKTGVTHTPGKTKHFQTLIISEELMLCDCPGLVFPSFSSSRHEMVSCGVLPIDRMTKHREAIQVVADRVPRDILEQIYKITLAKPKPYEPQSRPPTAAELLRAYCASRGHVSHGGQPDETRAARQILKDYIDGKIPHYELPPGVVTDDEVATTEPTVAAAEGPTASAADESDSDDSDEQDDTTGVPDMRCLLSDLESFDLAAAEGSNVTGNKKQHQASQKQRRKPQRKKDRSWRASNDGSDGTAVVRDFQKPAVNTPTASVNGNV
uniref:CP-type G domain-containing protein n=2 Tax=Aegilops tauschii subsp. strangulata TaxID=200361 RepID=A0A453JKQ0_AEGTS